MSVIAVFQNSTYWLVFGVQYEGVPCLGQKVIHFEHDREAPSFTCKSSRSRDSADCAMPLKLQGTVHFMSARSPRATLMVT